MTIPQGRHVYPFTFDLPRNGPSSFEADTGRIRYYLLCKMIVVGGFNRIAKKMVFVLRPLDLNTVPKAKVNTVKPLYKNQLWDWSNVVLIHVVEWS